MLQIFLLLRGVMILSRNLKLICCRFKEFKKKKMFADIIKCINIFLLEQIKIACYTKQMFVNIYSLYKVYMPISEIISTIINKISVRNTV